VKKINYIDNQDCIGESIRTRRLKKMTHFEIFAVFYNYKTVAVKCF